MRKSDLEDPKYRCCFCCHVRFGTIVLGLWHLILHVLVLGCLITSSLHPQMLREENFDSPKSTDVILDVRRDGDNQDTNAVFEVQYETPSTSLTLRKIKREDLCFAFALVMCTFLIALMLVYGAVKRRPGYLMPFFFLQVFDFCITCLTVVGYITYAPNIKLWVEQQHMRDYPGMDRLLQMDEKWLMLLFVIVFALIISIKAYLLDMVWSCYKYLQMKRTTQNNMVEDYTQGPDSEMLLPPKYEEVLKMKEQGMAPPPYTA